MLAISVQQYQAASVAPGHRRHLCISCERSHYRLS